MAASFSGGPDREEGGDAEDLTFTVRRTRSGRRTRLSPASAVSSLCHPIADIPRTLGVSPPFPLVFPCKITSSWPRNKAPSTLSPSTIYLVPLPRAEVRAKPGFPRPSPLPRSQPPSARLWVLHGARQARAVLSSGAPGPILRLQAADARESARPEAASLPRWSPRLALPASFRSAPGSQGLSVGNSKTRCLFSPSQKPLFEEKMLLSSFISRCKTTFHAARN